MTPIIVSLIGAIATIVAAFIGRKREQGRTERTGGEPSPGDPAPKPSTSISRIPTPRPNFVFVAILALGIALTAVVVALWPRQAPSMPTPPLSFTGSLSNGGKAKAHGFFVRRGTVIVIQPKATSSAALYFDLTVQSPSGQLTTAERFRSTQGSAPFPYTATVSGEYLLLVSMRPDGDASAGPYLINITEQ